MKKIEMEIFAFIWWLSETTGIGLGRFAPFVFGKMIGCKGVRICRFCHKTKKEHQKETHGFC